MPRTICPHHRLPLVPNDPQTDPPIGHCPDPACRSTFYLSPDGMPTLRDLAARVACLDNEARGLVAHFANNSLAAIVGSLDWLAEEGLDGEHGDAVRDALEAAKRLHLVIGTLTTVDTNVQSR